MNKTLRTLTVFFTFTLLLIGSAQAQMMSAFHIKGKVVCNKAEMNTVELLVINGSSSDTSHVAIEKGRFNVVLGLNATYLLIAKKNGRELKKILISSNAPATAEPYEMRLTLDVSSKKRQLGLISYNYGERRISIKALRKEDLKMRQAEFEPFSEGLMAEFSSKRPALKVSTQE